jgi:hypothetical protein
MTSRLRIGGGLAAGLALLLAGCSSGSGGPSTDGPFGASAKTSPGSQCFWAPRNEVGTFAGLVFGNSGGQARIKKVALVNARHLQLVAAWTVPITGHNLMGVFDGYPPNRTDGGHGTPGVQWGRRQRADGATIPHIPGKGVDNLVLVLKASGTEGTARTEDVYYTSGGITYLLNLGVGIQLYNGNEHGCQDQKT